MHKIELLSCVHIVHCSRLNYAHFAESRMSVPPPPTSHNHMEMTMQMLTMEILLDANRTGQSQRCLNFRAMMMIMTLIMMKMMLTMMTIASGRLRTVATSPERSLPSASVSIHSHLGFVYTHILLCNAILLFCSQPCFKAFVLCIRLIHSHLVYTRILLCNAMYCHGVRTVGKRVPILGTGSL